MASVKAIMNCLDIDTSGTTSILGDFFGFIRNRVPPDPTGVPAQVSLLAHVRGCQGQHIHLNVIRVGFDAISGGAPAQDVARQKLDYAIMRTRAIYQQVNLGVGRVLHWFITAADSGGADDLGSADECDSLIEDWSVPNDGVDAFVVRNISDSTFVGKASDIPGECDKEAKDDGVCAGEIGRAAEGFARTFAHEIGHHLGLSHNHGAAPNCPGTANGCNNLMAQTRCATSCGGGTRAAVLLTGNQGTTMLGHCSVRSGC
ncbi:zinc-dependent metalloprotease family protein [Actinosynnema sp. CS-041913]|uniref:zinc-dependent metalloprotease family protein n=1 Tax=Actinosynnema sp. CS-041913 TaxID=3239917 RepID=UPI003D920D6C